MLKIVGKWLGLVEVELVVFGLLFVCDVVVVLLFDLVKGE